jgi:hypothetical protein
MTFCGNAASRYGPVTSFAISMGAFLGSFVALGLGVAFQTHLVESPAGASAA